MVTSRIAAACAALVAAGGCTAITDSLTGSFEKNGFSGDPYPILTDTTSGGLVVGLAEDARSGIHTAVLDVMSPITIVDRGVDTHISVDDSTLTLYGQVFTGGGFDQPRARFVDREIVTLHPCETATETCAIGPDSAPLPFDAVLGMDVFSSDALRIRRATDEIFVFPDLAGDDLHRTRACDAVFPSTFRGGGTLLLGGTEVSFSNRRIAIDTCIAPNPSAATQNERGLDALFVLSTAVGPSILNESTYARYLQLDPTAPALDTLPEQTLLLPSGPIPGRATTLPSIALVGNLPSNPRAPCRQVYAHHFLATDSCRAGDDCPCTSGETFCSVPAIVELAPVARLAVLVVSDADPTLQALRTELRPDRPEVDGILGLDALAAVELDIDYPHRRLLARCVDRQTCGARVTLADHDSPFEERKNVRGCLADEPGPIP
jgi:hypothetical protein